MTTREAEERAAAIRLEELPAFLAWWEERRAVAWWNWANGNDMGDMPVPDDFMERIYPWAEAAWMACAAAKREQP